MGILKMFRRKNKTRKQLLLGAEEEHSKTTEQNDVPAGGTTTTTTATATVYPNHQSSNGDLKFASADLGSIHTFQTSFKPAPMDLTPILISTTSTSTQDYDHENQDASDLPPPPSCTHGSSLRDRPKNSQSGKSRNTPSVHFSPRHHVIITSGESSTMDLSQALSSADDEMTYETSTYATFKTNNSESSLNYFWRYITCNLGTKSTFDLRLEDDFTIDSDLVSAWTGRTGDTGSRTTTTHESMGNKPKRVTWSASS
mmetsp:Transcript_11319/g.21187  ORF Transcript_11319/g.21187 Transcript_11319/m.21187 type:complete len:256 (-) Transcript_11319:49-816(-)